jgi:ketopantoate hydroxymethyltransferase
MKSAITDYIAEVKSGNFPTTEHSSAIDETILKDMNIGSQ